MYIGNQPLSQAFVTDQFSGNGSTTAFTMSVAPANTASVLVAVSGVLQDPSTYSVSGTTLTFSAAPPTATGNISARYLGIPASGVTTTAYRTITEFTATAAQTTFTPASYTVGFIQVFRNGVLLGSADYTASNGTTVVLAVGATAGDLVTTESFYVSSVLNAIPATAGSVNSTYIAAGAVGTTQIAASAVTPTQLSTQSQYTGFKNRIINGGMKIDQRNSGAAQTITAAAALAYTIDRWYAYCTGANVTGQRVAGSGNNQYNYRFTGAASVTAINFAQRIESLNSYDLAGQTCTLSVNLSNSLLTTVTWTAYYANTADTFGSVASPTVTSIATGTFTVNSTLTNYSVNIAIPSAATTGIQILFSVGAQISGTWIINNAQLEVGSTATSFDVRDYGREFILCQRYYQVATNFPTIAGTVTSANDIYYSFPLPVQMRADPTSTRVGTYTLLNTNGAQPAIATKGNGYSLQTYSASAGWFYYLAPAGICLTFASEL